MDVLNLSRVFGPTLVGHSSANPTPLAIMEDTPRQCKVLARLLSLPPDFWRGFLGTEQENLVPTPALGSEHGEAQEPWPPPCPYPVAADGSWVPAAGLGCLVCIKFFAAKQGWLWLLFVPPSCCQVARVWGSLA
uniref:Rho-GAP domain-containing protein n=1 Tax=Bubo bubo TaxID=30461 RepID=A0A8C0ENX8_BUBBB